MIDRDADMRKQGWYKLMTPQPAKRPSVRQLAYKKAAEAEFERRAAEAIEWCKRFI
jgi:hypothetical protein